MREWAPRGSRGVIVSMRSEIDPERSAITHDAQAEILWEHRRGGVFARRSWDLDLAAQVLEQVLALDCSMYVRPTRADVRSDMGRLSDSAPGRDGDRYSAWRACGPAAVDAVFDLIESMFRGEVHGDCMTHATSSFRRECGRRMGP